MNTVHAVFRDLPSSNNHPELVSLHKTEQGAAEYIAKKYPDLIRTSTISWIEKGGGYEYYIEEVEVRE